MWLGLYGFSAVLGWWSAVCFFDGGGFGAALVGSAVWVVCSLQRSSGDGSWSLRLCPCCLLPRVGVARKARYSDRSCPYVCLFVCFSVCLF